MGEVIYTSLRFEKTFYVFAAILTVFVVVIIFIIPDKLNRCGNLHPIVPVMEEFPEPPREITYWILFTNGKAMIAAVSSMIAMILILFFDSILSDRMLEMGVHES